MPATMKSPTCLPILLQLLFAFEQAYFCERRPGHFYYLIIFSYSTSNECVAKLRTFCVQKQEVLHSPTRPLY